MTATLESIRDKIQRRLGDTDAAIWTEDELDAYIQRGYDELALQTGILWDFRAIDRTIAAFNYTAPFELDYGVAEMVFSGRAQFTSLFERDYVDNAEGPANHNHPWEYDDGYVEDVYTWAVLELPENFYQTERVTWKDKRVEPLRSTPMEHQDGRYELNGGEVDGYLQDKDGLERIRLWRAPPKLTGIATDEASEDWGIIRQWGSLWTGAVDGVWGESVSVPNQDASGEWGIVRLVTTPHLKVEYRRRGAALATDETEFEMPDRYAQYVLWFAMGEAYGREGDGQELELAGHYAARFAAGIDRINRRRLAGNYQKVSIMGGSGRVNRGRRLAQLPWQYGKVVR